MGLLRPGIVIALVAVGIGAESSALAQSFTPIRVNAGGSSFTDSASNVWSADTGYNTGSTGSSSNAISGTTDDTLYQTNRWDSAGGSELEYAFTVPNGFYQVRLLFAETWSGGYSVGARVFDVQLEGSTVISNLDVYAEAGANAAFERKAITNVTDGQINVRFIHGVADNPSVSGIEITATTNPSAPTNVTVTPFSATQLDLSWTASIDDGGVAGYEIERCQGSSCTNFALIAASTTTDYTDSALTASTSYRYRLRAVDGNSNYSDYSSIRTATTPGTTPPSPIRINAGGSSYTDSSSNVWSADTGYNTGSTASTGSAIAGTTDDTLYQSNRWDSAGGAELEYALTVPTGQYQVKLHFAETWSGAFSNGARVFHVQLEGVTTHSSVDVYAAAGANTAHVRTATVGVADGQLNIRFIHVTENPSVSGIEVTWFVPSDTSTPSTPSGLSATPISGGAVALSWSASTDNVGVAGYDIERCTGTSCTNFAKVATATDADQLDTGLVANQTYRYRVRAFDATGNRSAYSSIDEATTPNASVEYVYDELGRLVLVTLASGASIVYAYDESGNVTAVVRTEP